MGVIALGVALLVAGCSGSKLRGVADD